MTDTRNRYVRLESQAMQAEEPSMHHGGSFSRYMELKNVKLREQFEAQALSTGALSNIFQGVCIYVNGYTNPSHQELKQLMALHGGKFENYFHRDCVTHIICNNLPDTKLKQLRKERKPIPFVRSDWIVASVAAGKLLALEDYLLDQIRDIPNQQKLVAYKAQDASLKPADIYPQLREDPGIERPAGDARGLEGDEGEGAVHKEEVKKLPRVRSVEATPPPDKAAHIVGQGPSVPGQSPVRDPRLLAPPSDNSHLASSRRPLGQSGGEARGPQGQHAVQEDGFQSVATEQDKHNQRWQCSTSNARGPRRTLHRFSQCWLVPLITTH